MTQQTSQKLNQINQDFYNKIAPDFDSSRHYHWPGWDLLWEKINLKNKSTLKILDLGCGNARFYDFISSKITQDNFEYYGLDFSQNLLEIAKISHQKENCHLIQIDIFSDNLVDLIGECNFDLIVLFGVMHHIPSGDKLQQLFKNIHKVLGQNSIFAFTTWQFLASQRVASKVVDPQTETGKKIYKELGLDADQLESGDYILDWNKGLKAYRYGHSYTESEIKNLASISNFTLIDSFTADGKEGNLNNYYIVSDL